MGDTLIERLDRDMASWKSIEIRLDTDHLNSDGGGDQYAKAVFKLHYIETGVGQRFKEELHLPEGGQAVLYRHYGDGTRCADESFAKDDPRRQTQVEIKRTFGIEARAAGCERLPGLSVYYLGDVPLARALASSTPLGNQKISGRVCEMFLFPDHNWGESKSDIVVWIDQVTATPVKESFYADESSRKADEPEQTWLAETIEKIDGHDFPVKSSNTLFARGFQRTAPKAFQHHRPGDVLITQNHTVRELHFNRDYPASTFWPVIQPGATVYDHFERRYTSSPTPASATPASARPLAAAEHPRDWTPVFSRGGIGLGVLLVVGAIILKRRS